MVPDAHDRPAAFLSFHLLRLELLPRLPKRTLSEDLAPDIPLSSIPDGAGHRADHHQHESRYGSALRHSVIIQADAEIPHRTRREKERCHGEEVPQAPRHHSVD